MERAVLISKTSAKNVPSLEEAERVVSFVLHNELDQVADKVASGTSTDESLRERFALTIAVVGTVESMYHLIDRSSREQWKSMERSAEAHIDRFLVKWMANANAELKLAFTRHRRRKLAAKASELQLVELDRNKRAYWAQMRLPGNAPLPVAIEVGAGLSELTLEAEGRRYQHLGAMTPNDPLMLAGQVVGLISTAKCLLTLFSSNQVATPGGSNPEPTIRLRRELGNAEPAERPGILTERRRTVGSSSSMIRIASASVATFCVQLAAITPREEH